MVLILTGEYNFKTTIYTYYYPCKGNSVGSEYKQHLAYIVENKTNLSEISCPRQLFVHNLGLGLEKYLDEDNNLLVMRDFNNEYDDIQI